jgi:hypothetical protein
LPSPGVWLRNAPGQMAAAIVVLSWLALTGLAGPRLSPADDSVWASPRTSLVAEEYVPIVCPHAAPVWALWSATSCTDGMIISDGEPERAQVALSSWRCHDL